MYKLYNYRAIYLQKVIQGRNQCELRARKEGFKKRGHQVSVV